MLKFALVAIVLALPLQSYAADSDSSGLQSAGAGVVSPQSGGILQPASGTGAPLQSADAGGGGIGQSGESQNLQQTGTSSQSDLAIQGSGERNELDETSNYRWLLYILMVLGATTVGTALVSAWQKRVVAHS